MNTKNRPRFGGFGVYAMLILLVIILWYTFTNNSTTSDFTRNERQIGMEVLDDETKILESV